MTINFERAKEAIRVAKIDSSIEKRRIEPKIIPDCIEIESTAEAKAKLETV